MARNDTIPANRLFATILASCLLSLPLGCEPTGMTGNGNDNNGGSNQNDNGDNGNANASDECGCERIITMDDGLVAPYCVAVDGMGNVYTTGSESDNAFRITPDGTVMELLTAADGIDEPRAVTADADGNAYVAGRESDNVVMVAPDGTVTEIMSAADGLDEPRGLALDAEGNLYVTSFANAAAFKRAPDGTITEINLRGESGERINGPAGIAVDAEGNVFVSGFRSENVLRVDPEGNVAELINSDDGILRPFAVAVDGSGNLFVAGYGSDNAYRIAPDGTITEIINQELSAPEPGTDVPNASETGLNDPFECSLALTPEGDVYISGFNSDNAYRVEPDGTITEVINTIADRSGTTFRGDDPQSLNDPTGVAVDADGRVYVAGQDSHNVFRLVPR